MPGSPVAVVHVTFSASARISLVQALERLGRKEEVLPLVDDLGYGPIEPGTFEQRRAWIDDELGIESDPWAEERIPAFWDRVATLQTPIVAWMSRRSASESCGLLELLWRVKHAPVSVVDVSEIADAFAHVRSDQIVDRTLIERATPVSDDDRARHAAEWQRLRAENAALRVMSAEGLTSAPITHFDDAILANITGEWQTCVRVIGATTKSLSAGTYRQPISDDLLFGRLLAVMDDEVIEGQNDGEYWSIQTSRVRRRPGTS